MAAAGLSQQTAEVCSGFCHPPAESSPDTPSSLHAKPLTPPSGSPWFSKSLCAHQETLCHTAGFQIPSPPPQASKSVTHQFQTVTFHSQPILGAAGFVTHGDVGRREGRARLKEAKSTHSLPRTGMLLLHSRTTQFGTCWQISLEENNTTSTLQRKISVQAVMQFAVSQEGLFTSHRREEMHCPTPHELSPAVLDCSFKQTAIQTQALVINSTLLTMNKCMCSGEDDNRGMTEKSLSAPGPESGFVSHSSHA